MRNCAIVCNYEYTDKIEGDKKAIKTRYNNLRSKSLLKFQIN